MSTGVPPRKRWERLRQLRDVVNRHVGKKGRPVKLGEHSRRWDMYVWECGSSACALGSFALSEYGRSHWKVAVGRLSADHEPRLKAKYKNTQEYCEQVQEAGWQYLHLLRGTKHEHLMGPFAREPNPGDPLMDAMMFFGLSDSEAEYIFLPESYVDEGSVPPSRVVKRIDEVIRKYEDAGV